ncbi:hypothetical protein D3C80_2079710 [compost metagenome]
MDQATGIKQVNPPATIAGGRQDVLQLQGRLAEQRFGALLFQGRQAPQQRLARAGGHQRGVIAQQLGIVLEVIEQRLEVLEVQ